MFEMPAASLLSLIPTPPAGGSALLALQSAGNGSEPAENGGFAQVLALLPAAPAKPAPGLDATAPEAGTGLLAAKPTATMPESGKILPVALPVAKPEPSTHSIPAGILAMLPQGDVATAVPAPAQAPTAQLVASPQAKASLTAKALPETATLQQEEPATTNPEVSSAPSEPGNNHRARLPLHRAAVTLTNRKSPHAPAKPSKPPLREEQVAKVASVASEIRPTLAPETPVIAAPAPQVAAKSGDPYEALPAPTAGLQIAPISSAIAPLPEATLQQPVNADQQTVLPSTRPRANSLPVADTPKIALPIADLVPPRTTLIPMAALTIEPETSLPVSLTITTPLRTPLARRGEALTDGPRNGSPIPVTQAFAVSERVQTEPLPTQSLPVEATPTTQALTAPAGPSPFTAPDLSAVPTASTERPADFTQIVDRLIAARDMAATGQPQPVHVSLSHAEFGKVSLRFTHDDGALSVALSSADPGFARAAQIAAPGQPPAADANAGNSNSQSQSRGSDSPAFASNGQAQSGSNGGANQRQSAPEFRSARGEPARQTSKGEDETTSDRRHRFA